MTAAKVGVDDATVYVPKLYLDMVEFAERRHLDPDHIKKGIGMLQMAIPDNYEDAATMASDAALELIRRNGLQPSEIGRIYVGTETMEDKSKPVASKVVGMLEQVYGRDTFSHVDGVDHVFACIGGTYALENTLDWIRSGRNRGKAGIVIATDVAKYELNSDGEYTQGAGAVAMLVKEEPRLIEIEESVGSCTKHERDFFKPLDREHPVVDGKYSIAVYLDAMKTAYLGFAKDFVERSRPPLTKDSALSDFADYFTYHLPFPEMATQAAAYYFIHEWRDLARWKDIERETGPLPPRKDYSVNELLSEDYRAFRKKFTSSSAFRNVYASKVYPSTLAGRRIGNTYCASIYIGFLGLTESQAEAGAELTGKRVGFASYGSGCSAKVFSGVYQEGVKEIIKKMNLFTQLDLRKRISFEDYETLHKSRPCEAESVLEPHSEFAINMVGKGKFDYGFRYYDFAS